MAVSLDGLYSGYGDIYSNNKTDAKLDELKNSINNTSKTSTEEELMDVCKEFEAYFIEQMYKSMDKMVPKSEESSNHYMQMFGDTLTQEYAKNTAEQGEGLGLAQMLFEQMKRNYGID
ncbi:MAG: rod-binding protein [Lachnospiraceae bacterium]|nr:rod-binding protein [Lachnospiraceae bacterium]